MNISVHNSSNKGIHIDLPNSLLFSPTPLNLLIQFGISRSEHKQIQFPPEAARQICKILKAYSKQHGPLELVRVDSANGDTVIITI